MLLRIEISNFAIIDQLGVSFTNGLNIITGETGAGKSILMNALGLVLGDRADTSVLREKSKKCFVEAVFSAQNNAAASLFLEEHDLDREDVLTIRREIAGTGKSRAFVNDTPVTLPQLKYLGKLLVDLHQQFDTLELATAQFQLDVTDAMAGNSKAVKDFGVLFGQYKERETDLQHLLKQKKTIEETADYHQFLLDELEELSLKDQELESIGEELKLLTHAEDVRKELAFAQHELNEGDAPLCKRIRQIQNRILSLERFYAPMEEIAGRLKSVEIELDDIAGEIENAAGALRTDQEKIERLSLRLDQGYRLLKKHQVTSTAELLALQLELKAKAGLRANIDDAIAKAEKATETLRQSCMEAADNLSSGRNKSAGPLAEDVTRLLNLIGMPAARLRIEVTGTTLNSTGVDEVRFLFDANKSGRFETLDKVASGGELSRLMLCIKSLVAGRLSLPTLIFDEIDAGIGGEAARQVGIIMKDLSRRHQMIAITHQPQIAAKADAHYHVHKQEKKGQVSTSIKLLDREERVNTIAQMLSGEKPSVAAVQNAIELIEA
jgi:DNA repair protein RecN (Recombination protein N)